jgi:hypothetical protein
MGMAAFAEKSAVQEKSAQSEFSQSSGGAPFPWVRLSVGASLAVGLKAAVAALERADAKTKEKFLAEFSKLLSTSSNAHPSAVPYLRKIFHLNHLPRSSVIPAEVHKNLGNLVKNASQEIEFGVLKFTDAEAAKKAAELGRGSLRRGRIHGVLFFGATVAITAATYFFYDWLGVQERRWQEAHPSSNERPRGSSDVPVVRLSLSKMEIPFESPSMPSPGLSFREISRELRRSQREER